MEPARVVVLIFLLFFVFLAPEPSGKRTLFFSETRQARLRHEYDILRNSTYGDIDAAAGKWVNLTGYREDGGYQWGLLPVAQNLSRKQSDLIREGLNREDFSVYRQYNGEVRGKFTKSSLPKGPHHPLNLTAINAMAPFLYNTDDFLRNITEAEGDVALTFVDTPALSAATRSIKADIALWTDSSPGNGWQAVLRGVHLASGSIILSTYSAKKFHSYPAFPQFALNFDDFNSSKAVINDTITERWDYGDDDILMGVPQCELIVWLHPHPIVLGKDSSGLVKQIEKELRSPEGVPIGMPPPLAFSAVIFSPDCGYILEAKSIYGPKTEVYWSLASRLILAFSIIIGLKIALLRRQMHRSTTPSTKSRIAYQGIVIVALGDGLILFSLIGILVIDEAAFLAVAVAAFLACVHVALLEIRFIFEIWTVQVGDPARAEEDRQRRAAPAPTTAEGTLPLPATASRTDGATPVILPADQGDPIEITTSRTSFATVYSRFYFTLVVLMFFSLWSLSWPHGARANYANLLAFCYFSFWTPQIYRNIVRNCRKALNWDYVVGTSVLRMIPVLYWYVAKNNLLAIETSIRAAMFLSGWVWLQIAVLASQQFLGPRLFVKDSWCPPAYDYHPVLQDDLEAGGLPVGLLASASEGKDKDDKTRKVFDCAICMNEIDVPVISKEKDGSATTWLEQRNYMVTPCRHIFHSECLEGWMNLRLVCPVCRETLPPL